MAVILLLGTFAFGAAAEAKTELVFWDFVFGGTGYVPAAQALVERFNQSQDEIHVTYQSLTWDNFYQVILTAVTGGAAPDLSTGAFPQPVQYAAMGEALDLTPIYEKWVEEGDPVLDDIAVDGAALLQSYEGGLYGSGS